MSTLQGIHQVPWLPGPEDNECLCDADSAERQAKTKYHKHK